MTIQKNSILDYTRDVHIWDLDGCNLEEAIQVLKDSFEYAPEGARLDYSYNCGELQLTIQHSRLETDDEAKARQDKAIQEYQNDQKALENDERKLWETLNQRFGAK